MDPLVILLLACTGVAFLLFVRMVSFETLEDAKKRRGGEGHTDPPWGNICFYAPMSLAHAGIISTLLVLLILNRGEEDDAYWGSLIFAIIYLVVYVLQRILEWRNYPGLRRTCCK
jgi:hypothetical protein